VGINLVVPPWPRKEVKLQFEHCPGRGVFGKSFWKSELRRVRRGVRRRAASGESRVGSGERRKRGLNVEEGQVRVWMPRLRIIRRDSSMVGYIY